jgi:ribosome maturation factor RimP
MLIAGSPLESRIGELITESVASLGFEIVRIKLMDGRRKTLQIMIDHLDGSEITAANCARVSRQVSAILDVEDPISGEYDLELSSPGIDRPLVRQKDFERYRGHEAKISLLAAQSGRKHFKGTLAGITEAGVQLKLDDAELPVTLNFTDISAAKLLLTDALIAESMNQTTNVSGDE